MKTIVLDTANQQLAIGLYDQDAQLDKLIVDGNRQQSELMLPMIMEMLEKNNLKLLELDHIVLTIGPGSFTGVRIALTFAKTLATVTSVKLYPISSLQAIAGDKKAIVVLDARSKKIFVGVYQNGQKVINEQILNIDLFSQFAKEYADYEILGDTQLVGLPKKDDGMLIENMFAIHKKMNPELSIHQLVPIYLKD